MFFQIRFNSHRFSIFNQHNVYYYCKFFISILRFEKNIFLALPGGLSF